MSDYLDYTTIDSSPPIPEIKFNLFGGKEAVMSESAIAKYKSLYPNLDVEAELVRCARKYNATTPGSIEAVKKYVSRWLENEERSRLTKSFSSMQNRNEKLDDKWWRELAAKPGNLIGHIKVE